MVSNFLSGLSKLPSEEAQNLAFDLAQRWIKTMWLAYRKYGAMFEKVNPFEAFALQSTPQAPPEHYLTQNVTFPSVWKYDVSRAGEPGGGGEYQVQVLIFTGWW